MSDYERGYADGAAVAMGIIGMAQAILQKKVREAKTMREVFELTGERPRFDQIMANLQKDYDSLGPYVPAERQSPAREE